MTEGQPILHDGPMCIRVWLEVGHECEPRPRTTSHSLALDWRVWVRSPEGSDISAFVHKVVFYLNPPSAFVYPKRVIQEPPYEIQESGCASMDIPIHVYLKHTTRPKMIKLRYSLHIENVEENSSETSRIYYDFENPTDNLHRSLIKGGGEIVARTGYYHGSNNNSLVIVPDREVSENRHGRKQKFLECRHTLRKVTNSAIEDLCPKCYGPGRTLKKLLKSVKMTKSEINIVNHLYTAYKSYDRSIGALLLPPMSDPIYRVPELPATLQRCIAKSDYPSN